MENVLPSRPKRSLVRRLFSRKVLAPVASLALLAGGGWGAYEYYGAEQFAETQPLDSNMLAHSAPSAKDELKMLFDAEVPPTTESQPEPARATTKKSMPAKEDRYALAKIEPPKLPPLVEEPQQEPSAKPLPTDKILGDRYATALTMPPVSPTPPLQEKTAGDKASDHDAEELSTNDPETEADIARGQEPSSNPLRSSGATPEDTAGDARAAFDETPATNTNPFSPKSSPSTGGTDQLTNALQNARPLPHGPQQPPTNPPQNRYQQAPSQQALTMPVAPPTAVPTQRAAPPLDIPNSRVAQTPPVGAQPLGAPPIAMQTPRTPEPMKMATGNPQRNLNPSNMTPTPGLANHPGTGRPGERLLEGAQSPAITIQKLAPEQIQVGKRCTFAIRVQNTGQRTAQNVQIRDEVPLGTELVGTAPRATVSGAEIIWNLGTLSPGEERTVEMELLPQEEGELGSVAMVSLTAQASAKSRCTRPELALRLSSKPKVHVGQQQVVQIEVSNPGSGDATGVMLLETIPNGVSHEAGPALEFEVGTLRPGDTKRLELRLTAEQAGRINNIMTARADAGLQVEANCEFEIVAPDLQLSVEGPQRRFLERPATYRVSVDNPGTASAKDIQLVTHLPKGMQFVSANNLGEYDSSTHSVHWSLAELPANERGTVELTALPIESGAQTLQIATKAKLGLEDRTDKQVLVEGLSALTFEATTVEALIEVGQETTYEIKVQNQGSKAATNVQVAAILPAGIRAMNGQGETRHTIDGERVIFAPLPQLAPKSDTTFRIQAQGIRPGDQRVRIQITSDDTQQPITKEVSTRVYADE